MQLKYRGQSYSPSQVPESKTQEISLQFLGQSYQTTGACQPKAKVKVESQPTLQCLGRAYAMA